MMKLYYNLCGWLGMLLIAVAMLMAVIPTAQAESATLGTLSSTFVIDAAGNKNLIPLSVDKPFVMGQLTSESPSDLKRIATLGDPKYLNVKIEFPEDEGFEVEVLTGGMKDRTDLIYRNPEKTMDKVEIPFGVHSLMVIFKKTNEETGLADLYTVAKDIYDLPDGSDVVFDVAECIHKVTFKPIGPDGNEISLALRNLDPYDNFIDYGDNGDFDSANTLIFWHNVHDQYSWTGIGQICKIQYANGAIENINWGDFYFNSPGNEFGLAYYLIATPKEGNRDFTCIQLPTYVCTDSTEPSETVISNDPANFQTHEQTFYRSLYSRTQFEKLPFSTSIHSQIGDTSHHGIGVVLNPMECDEDVVNVKQLVCRYVPSMEGADDLDMINIDILPEHEEEPDLALASMHWKSTPEGREYLPINHGGNQAISAPFETVYNLYEGNYDEWLVIKNGSNPYLSYKDQKQKVIMGNNTPIIVAIPYTFVLYGQGSDVLRFGMGLEGRCGEGNFSEAFERIDIEEVSDYDENNYRQFKFNYDYAQIDGEIEGKASVLCNIKHGGIRDDFMPPVLNHLWFFDKDDYYTDRFATPEDGTLEIYAADFYEDYDWELGASNAQCLIQEIPHVTIEYAPYQTTQWTKLEHKEIKEKYWFPAYGQCFQADLKSVDRMSENGWFDLKITLQDERGNNHIQTISPAFFIDSQTGIQSIDNDEVNGLPTYFDLQGRRVKNPERGIYIEKCGNTSRKVVIR